MADLFVTAGGLRLHIIDHGGDGPPLFLLHGFSSRAGFWNGAVAAWGGRFRCYAMDLRGHGDSGHSPGKAYRVADFAADVRAVVSALGLDGAAFVGHSLGGKVGMALPDLFSRYCFVGASAGAWGGGRRSLQAAVPPASFADAEEAFHYMKAMALRNNPATPDSYIRDNMNERLRPGPGGRLYWKFDPIFLQWMVNMPPLPDQWEDYRRIERPILLLRGERDPIYTAEAQAQMLLHPQAHAAVIAGCGHAPPSEAPDAFARATLSFLEGSVVG